VAAPATAPMERGRGDAGAPRSGRAAASRRGRTDRRPRLAASRGDGPPAGGVHLGREIGRRAARARDRADAVRARRGRGLLGVLRRLPRRRAARAGDPGQALDPPPSPGVAMGGARVGGHQAADRLAARRRHPAPHRAPVGTRGSWSARRPGRGHGRRGRAGGARVDGPGAVAVRVPDQGRARGRFREGGPPDGGRRTAAARDPRDRHVDRALPGAVRPRRPRRVAVRRPRLPEGDRPARGPGAPRRPGGGRGVLRPLRAVSGARRDVVLAGYHKLVAKGPPLRRAA